MDVVTLAAARAAAANDAAAKYLRLRSNVVLLWGDSISAAALGSNTATQLSYASRGFITWAAVAAGHRFTLAANGGVSGDTQAQINARIPALLTANPTAAVVIDQGGVNSISANVDTATLWAQKLVAYGYALAAGRTLVVTTITPKDTHTTAQRLVMHQVNRKIREYARTTPGVLMADFYSAVADATTGNYVTNYTYDGLHPATRGAMREGNVLAAVLNTIMAPVTIVPASNNDSTNLLTNGLQVGTTGTLGTGITGSTATSWSTNYGVGSGTAVASKVARTDYKPGEWTQLALSAGTGTVRHTQFWTSGLVIGGTYRARAEFQTDAGALFQRFYLRLYAQDSGNAILMDVYDAGDDGSTWDATTQILSGVFETPDLVLPATSTRLQWEFRLSGTGTARIGACDLIQS